jgi:ABC-type transport system involved in multi-copper enzyme maturation permease subunit
MTLLYAAELLKLKSVRGTWGFVLVAIGLAALFTAGGIGGVDAEARFEPGYQFRLVLDMAFPTGILSLLLGIILFTNEFRHGTIARTLLATPRRWRLVVTKLVTGATTGAALEVVALGTTLVIAAIWLKALDVPLEHGDLADGAGRAFVGVILAGVVGAALGGAVHSQVGALVGALVWMFVVEPLCWVLLGLLDWEGVADYLPAASLGGVIDSDDEGLPFAGSVGMTLAWIALLTLLALVRTGRRDIT